MKRRSTKVIERVPSVCTSAEAQARSTALSIELGLHEAAHEDPVDALYLLVGGMMRAIDWFVLAVAQGDARRAIVFAESSFRACLGAEAALRRARQAAPPGHLPVRLAGLTLGGSERFLYVQLEHVIAETTHRRLREALESIRRGLCLAATPLPLVSRSDGRNG